MDRMLEKSFLCATCILNSCRIYRKYALSDFFPLRRDLLQCFEYVAYCFEKAVMCLIERLNRLVSISVKTFSFVM